MKTKNDKRLIGLAWYYLENFADEEPITPGRISRDIDVTFDEAEIIKEICLEILDDTPMDKIRNNTKRFVYKTTISDKLALGYGSKYQLLRMLGFHRNYFNNQILESINEIGDINWLDFKFNNLEDKELMNASFINEKIEKSWEDIWPTNSGTNGINWDCIGLVNTKYILLEAKANLDECGNPSKICGGKGRDKAIEAINKFQDKYGIERQDWTIGTDIYQIANRLVFLDFLLSHNIEAKLVYVLFLNGYELNAPENKSVKEAKQWYEKIDNLLTKMGIKNTEVEKMINICIIDANQSK